MLEQLELRVQHSRVAVVALSPQATENEDEVGEFAGIQLIHFPILVTSSREAVENSDL